MTRRFNRTSGARVFGSARGNEPRTSRPGARSGGRCRREPSLSARMLRRPRAYLAERGARRRGRRQIGVAGNPNTCAGRARGAFQEQARLFVRLLRGPHPRSDEADRIIRLSASSTPEALIEIRDRAAMRCVVRARPGCRSIDARAVGAFTASPVSHQLRFRPRSTAAVLVRGGSDPIFGTFFL